MEKTLLIIGIVWFLAVTVYVVMSRHQKTKVIKKKPIVDNSPIRRSIELTAEAKEVDDIIDSGNLSVMIRWNENNEVNPKLLLDLEEDIQDVIFRKDRGENKLNNDLKIINKEIKIDFNKYKNLINT